jgi:hypothetical protein
MYVWLTFDGGSIIITPENTKKPENPEKGGLRMWTAHFRIRPVSHCKEGCHM